jgi:hypothetical protein
MSIERRPMAVRLEGHQVCCEECDAPIAADPSRGVWGHDPGELGDTAYELNEDHAARPPEGTRHPGESSAETDDA